MCEYIHAYTAYTRMFVDVCCFYLRACRFLSRSLSLSLALAVSLALSHALPPSHTHKEHHKTFFFFFFLDTVELSEGASESMSLLRHFFLDSAAGGFEFL